MPDETTSSALALLETTAPSILGRRLAQSEIERFCRYEQILVEWNRRINLTAIVDPIEIERRHFLDSLACLLGLPPDDCAGDRNVVDVGAGAGFPGVPLAIVCPSWRLTLVESVGKKAAFLAHLVRELGLDDVAIVAERAEDLGQSAQHREEYDRAFARAVAPLNVLVEYCLPLLRIGGILIAPKKADIDAEIVAARRAIDLLGGAAPRTISYSLPGIAEDRALVVVEKVAPTPREYPRRTGIPAKKPLR